MNAITVRDPKIIVAVDVPSRHAAHHLVRKLDPEHCRLKIGKELFGACGPIIIEDMQKRGFDIFLDLKFHDILNTVAQACKVAASQGVWMVNVHALGGRRMMEAAAEALASFQVRPRLVAVTILTSMEGGDLEEVGIGNAAIPIFDEVRRLALLARSSGADGVVCSAKESEQLREVLGPDFLLVTPGIRLPDGSADDQKRIVTPENAIRGGSNYLVVGRPITGAEDPGEASRMFNQLALSASYG